MAEVTPPTRATLAKYGFGSEAPEYDTPEADWLNLLREQGGVCPVCGQVPSTGRFVVDHEHVKGWKKMAPEQRRKFVRGLVCWFCNHAYLGRGITIAKAEGVVRYLKRYAERRDG